MVSAWRFIDKAQWHASSLSGKTVHLTFDNRTLVVEPRDCILTEHELDWFYDTKLPELILEHGAGETVDVARIAGSINNVVPTKIIFLHAGDCSQAAEQFLQEETRTLTWGVDPYAFESRFTSLLFLDAPFAVRKPGRAGIYYSQMTRMWDKVEHRVRT